jgi:hypothetical protein
MTIFSSFSLKKSSFHEIKFYELILTFICRIILQQQYAGRPIPAQTVPATIAKHMTKGAARIFPPRIEPRINLRLNGLSG